MGADDAVESGYDCSVGIPILQDYVKSEDPVSLEDTLLFLSKLLPKNNAFSTEIYNLGEDCFEVAEESSWRGSTHLRLVQLLGALESYFSDVDTTERPPSRYQLLKESTRENLPILDGENTDEYVNYHSFAAQLEAHGILYPAPTLPLWAMRDALEEDRSNEEEQVRSAYLLGAAQWILWHGRGFFEAMTETRSVSADDERVLRPGSLYQGKSVLSLERWGFWIRRFEEVIQGSDVSGECKGVVGKVIMLMDSFQVGDSELEAET